MDEIAGLPFWETRFDSDGTADPALRDLPAAIAGRGVTDLVLFAHGWNSDPRVSRRLYQRFFGLLAEQAGLVGQARLGLAGVLWPARRWSDEPIPDFDDRSAVAGSAGAVSYAAALAELFSLDPDAVEAVTRAEGLL